eukprot:m.115450 g.115450  ORF g.115450 m.115450 type:complete len:57 (+) comp15370_c1_seq1:158-328(+)
MQPCQTAISFGFAGLYILEPLCAFILSLFFYFVLFLFWFGALGANIVRASSMRWTN